MSLRGCRLTPEARHRKYLVCAFCAAFILTLLPPRPAAAQAVAYAAARNLLQNGSFERAGKDADNGVPHGWSLSYGTKANAQTYRFGGSSPFGSQVLQLLDRSDTATVEIESDYIEIVPGGTYTVEGWIREYAPATNKAYLYIKTYDAARKPLDHVRNGNPGTAGWHRFSKSHRMPAGAVYAKVACRSSADSWGAAGSDERMRFDGIAFYQSESESGSLLFRDAFDLALSEGCCAPNQAPAGWFKSAGTGDPDDLELLGGPATAVAFNDHAAAGRIVILSPHAQVSPGADYRASAEVWIDPGATGQKGYLYLGFYDRHGVRLPTRYHAASTTRGAYRRLTVGGPAPAGAAHARVLLTTTVPGAGQVRMRDVTLAESYDRTRWVSPDGVSVDGASEHDPAAFNDPVFWNGVGDALAGGDSVRVVFKAGANGAQLDYEVNGGGDAVKLDRIGLPQRHLLIEGETAHAVRFVRPAGTARDADAFIVFDNATHVTLRNFVFQDLQTGRAPRAAAECGSAGRNHCIARPVVVNSGAGIRIENVSLQDLPNSKLGGITARLGYDGVWIADSDFIGIGLDHFAHSIYAQWGRNLVLSGNYSEDSLGTHFKLKGEITGSDVIDNAFVSTGTGLYHPANAGNHENFVYLNAEHVTGWPGWFGSAYNVSGNRFDYRGGGDGNGRVAVAIGHGGCDPAWQGVRRRHLLTRTESDKLNAVSPYGETDRKEILRKRFKLDFDDPAGSVYFGGNTRLNRRYHTRDVQLRSTWSGAPACAAGRVKVKYADLSGIDND